jgi:hypothetical protein
MINGEKWVMGGKELWHLFFLEKKPWSWSSQLLVSHVRIEVKKSW